LDYLPDIRDVIKSLAGEPSKLFPSSDIPIGFQWFGLRQANFNSRCGCDPMEGTTQNHTCTRCLNTGFLFTDYLVKGFFWLGILGVEYGSNPGLISTQQKNLIIKHNKPISKFDFALELDYDEATEKVKQPFVINKYFKVQDSTAIKGDNSRIEFYKCAVEERNIKDGRPQTGGTDFTLKGDISVNEHFGFRAT